SEFTATGPCWTDNRKHFGYMRAAQSFKLLKDPELELFAIIEPETDPQGEARSVLRLVSKDHVIDGSNAGALKQLDVMVSCFQWNVRPQVLEAMTTAVNDGVGLLFQASLGSYRPGYTADVQKLQ